VFCFFHFLFHTADLIQNKYVRKCALYSSARHDTNATIERCFLCGPRQEVITRTARAMSWFFAREFSYPEDGGDTILRNVGSIDHIYTAPHPRRRHSSISRVVPRFVVRFKLATFSDDTFVFLVEDHALDVYYLRPAQFRFSLLEVPKIKLTQHFPATAILKCRLYEFLYYTII
jgi:hypothetical protein